MGFKGDSHPTKIDKTRVKNFNKENKLKYYNYGMHLGSFRLPTYVRDMLYGPEDKEE